MLKPFLKFPMEVAEHDLDKRVLVLLAGLVVQYFHDWPGKIDRLTTVRHRVLGDEPLAMLGWKDY